MPPHDELGQLSAYLDGELDETTRARIDSHLPGCAECRATLGGLKATLADLSTLLEAVPTEQDSWALRSAIARARKPAKRWQRFAFAAGTAAAALIAVVAITHHSSTGIGSSTHDTMAGSGGTVPIFSIGGNFDQFSAQAHLLDVSGKVPASAVRQAPLAGPAASGNPKSINAQQFGAVSPESAVAPNAVPTAQLDRCVGVVQQSQQGLLDPVRYELATFDNTPAFFLFFRTSDRFQLWVMSRDQKHPCDVLFFAQTH